MRKTSFFYGKKRTGRRNRILAQILVWLVLLNLAFEANVERKEGAVSTEKEAEASENVTEEPDMGTEEAAQEEIKEETAAECIRVLLTDSDFQSYYHSQVSFTAQGQEYEFTWENTESGADMLFEGGEEGILVHSITRTQGEPVYQGTLRVRRTEEGFLLVNTLSLEEYLKSVVPSEMPSSYEMEALKAQAVCARTYACRQMQEGKLEAYEADVEDSVNDQVYNNISPSARTDEAVEATKGQVLCQNGELIEAYYFSTSAGMTSTDEIWGADEAASYLKSVVCTFDSQEPWSRWQVTVPWENLEERAANLENCSGELKSMEITRKSQSGAVIGLMVYTEGGSSLLSDEYEIRRFLSPQGQTITEKNGETVSGGVLLPSSYFTLQAEPGVSVSITGGGYGHGVGMSQNGANQMAKEGYTCEEILDYFFKDVLVQQRSFR